MTSQPVGQTDEETKVIKEISKIEIFKPKRKYNRPVRSDVFIPKGAMYNGRIAGMDLVIINNENENLYLRFK